MTMVYHELRAPLALVVTAALSVAEESADAFVRGRCEMIARAAERMLRTANEFMHVPEPLVDPALVFSPYSITNDAIRDLSGLSVPVTLEAAAGTEHVRCRGEAATFETLLYSLISNARDHSAPGTPITVELAHRPTGIEVRVTNLITTDDHHDGIGAGAFIEQALAAGLGATVSGARRGICYVACLRLPASGAGVPGN
jgi:signal transduction histidine kinase